MTPNLPPALLTVEAAFTEQTGKLIGLRLAAPPPARVVLLFNDQETWPGFRLGNEFVPNLDETIIYKPVNIHLSP